jgi:CDP-2,3-bis-(O-geranylgeranyl)-sn-glycerol synthase
MSLLQLILSCIWFFLPAGIANMSPSFATTLFGQGKPIDGGKSWHHKRIFGDHKTWRGLVVGIAAGSLFFLLQVWLYRLAVVRRFSIIDYSQTSVFMGVALGSGALFGDMVKSFIKRRVDIPPGTSWIPFDQIDYVLGGLLLTLPFALQFSASAWQVWLTVIIIFFILHIIVNILGWAIGLKKNKL